MGTGDYVCVTLRGGAPWGFRLRQGAQEMQLQVFEIEEDSRAALVGLCEDDELLSVNGKSCSNLSLSEAIDLIEASADCLQLLVKRCCSQPSKSLKSVSTTLRIPSPSRPHDPQELYILESQDEAYYGETDSDAECQGGTRLVRTQVQIPSSRSKGRNSYPQRGGNTRIEVTPGSVVELQLSLSKTTLEQPQCTSLGSASGFEGDVYHKTNENFTTFTPGFPLYIPRQDRQPLGQRGVLVSKTPAFQKQLEVTVQQLCGSEKEGADASDRLDSPGEEGGHTEEVPTSSSVSFGLPSEEWDSESEREVNQPNKHRARHARLRRSESLSDKQVKEAKSKCKRIALLLTASAPNLNNKGVLMFKKHRQRAKKYTLVSYGTGEDEPHFEDDSEDDDDKEAHAVEITILATGETEVDEDFFTDASGRKRIVNFDWDTGLLEIERQLDSQQDMEELPETKGKGALMFAQRKQRMDEIVAEHEELRRKGIPVDRLQDPDPHQMYQHTDEHTYMQAQETQNYMDVNLHHSMSTQKQQEQQYQQYQEQYYQQQPQQQPQQQQYQDYQQQLQYQQQYQQQQDYQQQKMIQQLQSYNQQQHFQQQQVQQYSHHMNGMFDQQKNEMQVSVENRSAKPFSVQNRVAAPFPPSTSAENQEQTGYTLGQGEQIASRDERISVPAIKTGILQDTRRRTANKPMFTFKESPKVSPNPELLHLLNKGNRKAGFETCPEEDYLSLGAEACNFLQSPKVKQKTPPPVAPKPHINPSCPPWSPQPESTEQPIQQHTENIVSAPAKAPATDADGTPAPVPEMAARTMSEDPKLAPESQEDSHGMKQHASGNAWKQTESPMEPSQQTESWNEKQHHQVSSSHHVTPPPAQSDVSVRSWDPALTQAHQHPPASAWGTNEVQLQVQSQKQSHAHSQWMIQSQHSADVQLQAPAAPQSQPSWVTQTQTPPQTKHQPAPQTQPQSQMNSWAPGPNQSTPQPPWSQAHESVHPSLSVWQQNQGHVQPSWAQQQQIQESQPSWATAPQQQQQPSWVSQAKPQLPTQPPANTWTQPQSPVQAPWSQQTQAPTQPTALMQHPTNHWDPMASQPQPQPQWAQEPASQQHPQQIMSTWTPGQSQIQPPWGQTQPSPQPKVQPPWGQKPQQQASQPPVSQWTPPQSQSQPAVNAWASQHQQSSISMAQTETQKLPSPPIKPWSPPQNTQPTPPRRMNSYTSGAKVSSPTPPSSIMSLSGFGSAFEMPALRGKGAELFAKRQSRMEKYIVDSTTVQSNKGLRCSSLSPPVRLPAVCLSARSVSSSPSPRHVPPMGQTTRLDRSRKSPTPWEAASRHPLGLVDEAFAFLDIQQSLASSLRYAAQSKILPEPPAEWKVKVAYEPLPKYQKDSLSQSPLSFLSPTKSTASAPSVPIPYGSPFRPCPAQRSMTEENLGPQQGDQKEMGPYGSRLYKDKDSSTWRH